MMLATEESVVGRQRHHAAAPVDPAERQFQQVQASIHQELVAALDLSKLADANPRRLEAHVRRIAESVCQSRGFTPGMRVPLRGRSLRV